MLFEKFVERKTRSVSANAALMFSRDFGVMLP